MNTTLEKIMARNGSFNLKACYRMVLLIMVSMISCHTSKAQFTIIDDFRESAINYPHIKTGGVGGTAYFTSGIDDPVGSGWLRLTTDQTNQRGYAYIDRSFPSGMGVLIDFEYTMWRSRNDSNHGGDGMSVFLFDADIEEFRMGGYGGSLGYMPNYPDAPEGLAGGYIGVGLDSYGSFGAENTGYRRYGGFGATPNSYPNAFVLRGPTTDNYSTIPTGGGVQPTNRFLAGLTLGDRTGTGTAAQIAAQIRQRDEIDYNTWTTTRPTAAQFYRRVQITLMPTGTGDYDVVVRWSKTQGGPFEPEEINYTITDPTPSLMKVGFAASTGVAYNFHEIRNILVTTTGNLRVTKTADRPNLRTVAGANEITYTLEVTNDTPAPIENIGLADTLKDANGNILDPSVFEIIEPIEILDASLNGSVVNQSTTPNIIEGTLEIAANSVGRIRVTGRLLNTPPGNEVINTVAIHPEPGTDTDTLNNIFTLPTPVYVEGADLIVGVTVDETCIDYVDGNEFTLEVSNIGVDPADIDDNDIVVTVTYPAGAELDLDATDHVGWTATPTGPGTYEFRLTAPVPGTLQGGFIHPQDITFRVTPELSTSSYTLEATVRYEDDDGIEIEIPDNRGNNTFERTVRNCTVVSNPMIYQRVRWQE